VNYVVVCRACKRPVGQCNCYAVQPQPPQRPGFGLGDVVARATKAVGIKPCPPCERRRKAMNRWLWFG